MHHKTMAGSLRQQVENQKAQVENLKTALSRLDDKRAEAQAQSDVLIAERRRSPALGKATEAGTAIHHRSKEAFERMTSRVQARQAATGPPSESEADGRDVEEKFRALEKEREIDRLLAGLEARRG